MRTSGWMLGIVLGALAAGPGSATEPARVAAVATGAVTGAYFPAAVALCRVANVERRETGLRCAALPSEGSVANLRDLRAGAVELALAQSDTVAAAEAGTGAFAEAGPDEGLRAVMALFPEPLALVARGDAGVKGLADLPGKRVGVGTAGSGQRALVGALMDRLGWKPTAFAEFSELAPESAANALCEGRLDAFFYAVGQPAQVVRGAVESCGATLADVAGPEVEAVVAADPALAVVTIPAGTYAGLDRDVATFGPVATLVTRADASEGDIRLLTAAVLDALPDLGGLDPLLGGLDPAAMARRGLTAPLHPGAAAAFRDHGVD